MRLSDRHCQRRFIAAFLLFFAFCFAFTSSLCIGIHASCIIQQQQLWKDNLKNGIFHTPTTFSPPHYFRCFAEKMWGKKAKDGEEEEQRLPEASNTGASSTENSLNCHLPLLLYILVLHCNALCHYIISYSSTAQHHLPLLLYLLVLHLHYITQHLTMSCLILWELILYTDRQASSIGLKMGCIEDPYCMCGITQPSANDVLLHWWPAMQCNAGSPTY